MPAGYQAHSIPPEEINRASARASAEPCDLSAALQSVAIISQSLTWLGRLSASTTEFGNTALHWVAMDWTAVPGQQYSIGHEVLARLAGHGSESYSVLEGSELEPACLETACPVMA